MRFGKKCSRPSLVLGLKQVYATITYYLHNRDSIRRYLEEWIEDGRRKRDEQSRQPSAAVTRLQQIKSNRQSVASAGNSTC
jgi:hypothetical protein